MAADGRLIVNTLITEPIHTINVVVNWTGGAEEMTLAAGTKLGPYEISFCVSVLRDQLSLRFATQYIGILWCSAVPPRRHAFFDTRLAATGLLIAPIRR